MGFFTRWMRRRFDRRGYIPKWATWIWPHAHWCPEMDHLLILTHEDWISNCFCKLAPTGKPLHPDDE